MKRTFVSIGFCLLLAASILLCSKALAAPSVVRLVKQGGSFHLTVDGRPFFIRGAGGSSSLAELKADGGNSIRTWGADHLGPLLARCAKLHIMVTVGIWLGHREQGFHYSDAAAVQQQYEMVRRVVLKYRSSPALLMWALGNEMEGYGKGGNPKIWRAVEKAAALTRRLDPNHPTMTVTAEIGGERVASLNKYCPDIDIMGINSYAGGPSLAERYVKAGGVKPFVVTEFGPPGTWESQKTSWGAPIELASTEKAVWYARTWRHSIAHQRLCLGGYAFVWGHKQEATATWYGMFLPNGDRLGAVDAMQKIWTGKSPLHPCPVIKSLLLTGPAQLPIGSIVHAHLAAADPSGGPVTVKWVLQADPLDTSVNGAVQSVPHVYQHAIVQGSNTSATVKLPEVPGNCRLFAYVYNMHKGAAVANIPLNLTGTAPGGQTVPLPVVIYRNGLAPSPYVPSGYMGNTGAIQMNPAYTDPQTHKKCIRVVFNAASGWGGVVWQNPANNWGKLPGGMNLSGAKELTFRARGSSGGEKVNFMFGVIGRGQPHYDTAKGSLTVTLTKKWHTYSIPVDGLDMKRILTGFGWSLASNGGAVTFYINNIEYK